ncbi:stemmadenine O-acetyltransferase [Tanacetum coccineum]
MKKEEHAAYIEIKRREVDLREREFEMQAYRQRKEDIRFYIQPYDHLTGAQLAHMEAMRAKIKVKYNLSYLVNGGIVESCSKKVDLDLISTQYIKPASPTPYRLRTFNLSLMDQYMVGLYTPVILFIPNTDNASVINVVNVKSRRLKEALSSLLTRYYPFAGEIKNNLHIECNDTGVYFVEARVNHTLIEFLRQPDDDKVRELNPKHPSTTESSLGNYVASVQVNVFNCGGIGLSTSMTHKIVDGNSYFTFMRAWAAAARGLPDTVSPSFVASEVFPNNPSLDRWFPSNLMPTKVVATKRFVFSSAVLASLKTQHVASNNDNTSLSSRGPTRTETTAALIWRAAAKAASTIKPFDPDSPHALLSLVNLRNRALPPLPWESIGNLIIKAITICYPNKLPDLATLMGEIRESIAKINSDHIESLKGEKGHKALKKMNDLMNVMNEGECLFAASLLNSKKYEIDFGWGRPIWSYHMNPGSPGVVFLNDVLHGGGVEAVVSLTCEEMEIFERDPEVLAFAKVNPSPLEFIH